MRSEIGLRAREGMRSEIGLRAREGMRSVAYTNLSYFPVLPSCQKATALAAATFRESTPWDMGIFTV